MKKAVVLLSLILAGFQATAREKVEIPANASVELTYAEFATYDVKMINRSGKQIDVSVLDPESREQVSGFGLAASGTATLYVAPGNILMLKNRSSRDLTMILDFVERKPAPNADADVETVSFTLRNGSMKSIPLIIPGVMKPNLSPMSNSGVALKRGQKIYYKKGLKKILVLTVDDSIQNGDKIDMAQRIKNLR